MLCMICVLSTIKTKGTGKELTGAHTSTQAADAAQLLLLNKILDNTSRMRIMAVPPPNHNLNPNPNVILAGLTPKSSMRLPTKFWQNWLQFLCNPANKQRNADENNDLGGGKKRQMVT